MKKECGTERTDMKFKLISGTYKKAEYTGHTAYEGYGIFNENNEPVAFLSWFATPCADKPINILLHKDGNAQSMPTLGHGISKIKRLYAELTNAN